jgi:WD40 repeat protein
VFSSSIHPNSLIAATGSHSGSRVWNLTTGQTLASFEEGCFFISFHGQYLIRDTSNGSISFTELLFDDQFTSTTSIKEDTKIFSNGNRMKGTAIVCSREKLLTCSEDGNLRIFDINTEECLYSFHHHQAQGYNYMALHPNETSILASNDNFMTFILRTRLY